MTEIVQVRFIKDSQSPQTGWEFYPAGATAHFYANQADVLVANGRAVLIGVPPDPSPLPPVQQQEERPDYSGLTVKQLKATMHEAGIPFTAKMRFSLVLSESEPVRTSFPAGGHASFPSEFGSWSLAGIFLMFSY